MALSPDLVYQFSKLANNKTDQKTESTVNGEYKTINDEEFVRIDGSDIWTPVASTISAETGDRVTVLIKNHSATVTGNVTNPSASSKDVGNIKDTVDEHGNTIKQLDNSITQQGNSIIQINNNIKQQENTINQFKNTIDQQNNTIQQFDNTIKQYGDNITSMNNTITSQGNQITEINNTIDSQNNTINQQGNLIQQQGNIISQQGNIISQQGTKIETFDSDIKILNSGFVIEDGVLTGLSTIITDKLFSETLDTKYANIDFSNIGEAAIEKLFTESGIIKDLVMSEGKVTGKLVGVTITGDLIEGNTVKADKLVILGEDGLYYKLNVNSLGEAIASSDEKYQNGLDGSNIIAKSIVAEKIAVDDLVAFGATIGGFHITDHTLYSGVKGSIDNTTNGVYLSDDGQIAIGDNVNYLKYFLDEDGQYKLEIQANSIKFGTTGSTINDVINETMREMSIGGRNLILESQKISSAFDKETKTWYGYGTYEFIENYKNNFDAVHATDKLSGICVYLNPFIDDFNIGDNMTFSVTIDNTSDTDANISYYNIQFDNADNRVYVSECNDSHLGVISAGEFKRISITIPLEQSLVDLITNGGTSRLTIQLDTADSYSAYFYAPKLEKGNTATDWTPAPEDINTNITMINTNISTLKADSDGIKSSVESIKNIQTSTSDTLNMLNNDIGEVRNKVETMISSEDVKMAIKQELDNGVSKVTTTTGFTFNEDGLTISKSGKEMTTNIDEDGMSIYRNDEEVLTADNQGVTAYNLYAKTYLIIGETSRFEDFERNGEKRTGCFWKGD